jgi:hypothetical protein
VQQWFGLTSIAQHNFNHQLLFINSASVARQDKQQIPSLRQYLLVVGNFLAKKFQFR